MGRDFPSKFLLAVASCSRLPFKPSFLPPTAVPREPKTEPFKFLVLFLVGSHSEQKAVVV